MRKRWLVGVLVGLLLVGGLVFLLPSSVYVPLGLFRQEAFFAGKPTNYWVRALKREDFLGHAPPAGDIGKTLREGGAAAVPVLTQIASNEDDNVRMEALMTLTLIGPEAKDAAPLLASTVKTEKDSGRFHAASEALARAAPATAADTFSAVLRDKSNGSGRAWTLAVLLELAPACAETVPALEEVLHDPDMALCVQAIRVLWRMKQPAEPLVAGLCEAASAEQALAGCQALEVLGEMGPAAASAVPTLQKLLARPKLADIGSHWGPPHRAAIVRALGLIGPAAAPAVPQLTPLLKGHNAQLRAEVVQALARISPPAANATVPHPPDFDKAK
jgi:HEAT repeat protein